MKVRRYYKENKDKTSPFLKADKEYIDSFIDEVEDNYGTVEQYLILKLDISKEEKNIFKKRYLEEY